MQNTQVIFKKRPEGFVSSENFDIKHVATPELEQGQLLIQNLYLSLDPYMRGRMNERAYADVFELGQVLKGGVVGRVINSRHTDFSEGELVLGILGWESYSLSDGTTLRKVPEGQAPLSTYLGILGMPGFTAYYGLLEIGKPKVEETVLVSAAAGAVGSAVGQIAKLKGCQVIGSAGSEEKITFLKDAGFDDVINYKTTSNLRKAVAEACPIGVDVYFDNVGADMLESALQVMNPHGRIVSCGMIAAYNDAVPRPGPNNLFHIIGKRLNLQGFIISDHYEHFADFLETMSGWLTEGKIIYRETITEGIENAPRAFTQLFTGEKIGKQIIKVG